MVISRLFGQFVMELGRFMSPPPSPLKKTRIRLWYSKSSVIFIFLIPSAIVFYPFQRLSSLCHRTHYNFYSLTMFILFEAPNFHSEATNIFSFLLNFFPFFQQGGGRRPVVLALQPIFFPDPATTFSWACRNFLAQFFF